MKLKFGLPLIGMALIIACQSKNTSTEKRTVFLDTAGMDTSVNPGDNFFMYANGKWMKNTVIPDDQSGWGSFYTLYEDNLKKLKGIVEEAEKENAAKGSIKQKVGDYYASGMDTVTIEKLGAEPLKPVLAKIDAAKDYKELVSLLAELSKTDEAGLLGMGVGADEKNSTKNIASFYQSGLSLPEKDYYFKTDSTTKVARAGFVTYAAKLFNLTGVDAATATKNANDILALETEIAKSHRSPEELRDPQKNYNKMSVAQLEQLAPNLGVAALFATMKVKTDSVNVGQPTYFKALSTLLASQPIAVWKTKFKYDYMARNAGFLSKSFVDASFNFNKIFNGQKKQSERWKKLINGIDGNLGDLLGQLYVEKYFTPEAKKRMDELVNNLQKVFATRIAKLDWMSAETKTKATEKLNIFLKKIGYTTKWKNFDDVTISKGDYLGNARNARMHGYNEMIGKIGKPVDKTEWVMTPPTVNAYYNPTFNEIVFPAGILQFPFFDANADDAINYGAIGAVIGHEMTHGFDDQGRQYDAAGNMKDWWTKADADQFKTKADKVAAMYSGFTLLDNQHVNGNLTLGENLADIGGLAIAYDAFKLTEQGKEAAKKIDGFTPDQRFFLAFAQVWRIKDRDENMRVRIKTDPHSPEMFRVNGPVYSMEAFYKAFNVPATAKMYIAPANRLGVW
ncbi:M13 family metallopeptidase [Pedobacter sp. Hv1]|uniref:M13 family metallopeptidase n=1 Tax=Pedobacter sp. Hv1 TaxID=1740090 RepID=UPI0006D88E07|nr:M13 family metallopeptidase [Pedobacter sp. Hv1]KQB99352.1 peptidase M13 [Pedobacter sp. Hv1]